MSGQLLGNRRVVLVSSVRSELLSYRTISLVGARLRLVTPLLEMKLLGRASSRRTVQMSSVVCNRVLSRLVLSLRLTNIRCASCILLVFYRWLKRPLKCAFMFRTNRCTGPPGTVVKFPIWRTLRPIINRASVLTSRSLLVRGSLTETELKVLRLRLLLFLRRRLRRSRWSLTRLLELVFRLTSMLSGI